MSRVDPCAGSPGAATATATGNCSFPFINSVVCADNLGFMSKLPSEGCALIYADPPFNSKQVLGPTKTSPHRFSDHHGTGVAGYLGFLRPRLAEMRRLLAEHGTLCVHLDWRSVHAVKLMLDDLFRAENFLNEIIWSYRSGGRPSRWFPRKHDTLLLYAKHRGQHRFNRLRGGVYRTQDLKYTADGQPYKSTRNGPIAFHPDGPAIGDVWEIPILSTVSRERTGYPTQKPEALLERLILASSDAGDLVADFFCGSGTTLAVAQRLGRAWVGCDENPGAVRIASKRLGLIGADGPGNSQDGKLRSRIGMAPGGKKKKTR